MKNLAKISFIVGAFAFMGCSNAMTNVLFKDQDHNNDDYLTFEEYWRGGEGTEDPEEDRRLAKKEFEDGDTNNDGRLSREEAKAMIKSW